MNAKLLAPLPDKVNAKLAKLYKKDDQPSATTVGDANQLKGIGSFKKL